MDRSEFSQINIKEEPDNSDNPSKKQKFSFVGKDEHDIIANEDSPEYIYHNVFVKDENMDVESSDNEMMSQKRRFYKDSYLEYGFSYVVKDGIQRPQCLVCLNIFSNGIMKPFQLKSHLEHSHPEMREKDRKFFEVKLSSLKRMKLDSTGTYHQTNTSILRASYSIALQVAKTKKAHNIGETLIKPCILESVRLVLGEEATNKMKQISLSNDTIRTRLNEMSDNIKSKVVSKMLSSPFFSLQLDESTDVSSISQLLVFCRYITDKEIQQEFLFCRSLETTTTASDVMEVMTNFFKETGLSWASLIGVCTDGAPAMLGSRSGFITLVKQKNPDVVSTHCMIHREALASKKIPENLRVDLNVIIDIVNYVKRSALNTRLFRELCKDMDAEHTALLFHTQVRWLSKGNMLARVFDLREEIKLFLTAADKVDMFAKFNEEEFETRLAYLADIFEALNDLNKKMQGTKSNVIVHTDMINAFIGKLQLWGKRMKKGNIASFQRISVIHGDNEIGEQLKDEIINHLKQLEDDFKYYFPGIDTADISMKLTKNPFICQLDEVPDRMQEEFIELSHDSSAKDEFRVKDLEHFWINVRDAYPQLSTCALKILILFSSTYLCESGFSALVTIKTKARNRLEVECDMRCALSNTAPDIDELVSKKIVQKSH